jgi:hypothetical protein
MVARRESTSRPEQIRTSQSYGTRKLSASTPQCSNSSGKTPSQTWATTHRCEQPPTTTACLHTSRRFLISFLSRKLQPPCGDAEFLLSTFFLLFLVPNFFCFWLDSIYCFIYTIGCFFVFLSAGRLQGVSYHRGPGAFFLCLFPLTGFGI